MKNADMLERGKALSVKVASSMPSRLASVPAFPSVAMRLLSLLADERCSFSRIAACIASDPVLSGRLIKRANAADQPRYCEVREVLQAAVALGIDRTREISLATATAVYARSAIRSDTLRPCGLHTLACAMAASELGRMWGLRPAESYTAGLLHDIGRLGLLAAYPAEYKAIIAGAGGQPEDLARLEHERFGVDHVEAGLWLARQWNLPESIVECIVRHHDPPTGVLDQTAVVQIACRLADLLGFSVHPHGQVPDLDEICAALPEWTRKRLSGQLHKLRDAVAGEIRLFDCGRSLPPGTPDATMDDEEPAEGPPAYDFPHEILGWLGALLMVIALLISAAALFLRG